jgi:hypothetical protein
MRRKHTEKRVKAAKPTNHNANLSAKAEVNTAAAAFVVRAKVPQQMNTGAGTARISTNVFTLPHPY